ncbi:hypothetical protein ABEB36_003393 [Hypothenemus hampei]|uniref:Uncharacterized protein n=1 Tax=Hypothenemus hampei TaxID=57062 RepID=A0ABD1F916_HYPHA
MQRILSVEASRNILNQPNSEFITKRFCWSFLLTVTFFSIVGGFVLGKFVSDMALANIMGEIRELSRKVASLNENLKSTFGTGLNFTYSEGYSFLNCNFLEIGRNQSGLLKANEYMDTLNLCFNNG